MLKVAAFISLLISLPSSAEIIERVVAVVNDRPITKLDLENYARTLRKGGLVDDLVIEDAKATVADEKLLLRAIINERIIDSEVRKQGHEVTIEKVEQEIRSISSRNKITRAQLKQSLTDQGVAFAEYQDFVKRRLERQSLVERAITSKIKISDEEVAALYFSQARGSVREAFEFTLSHILFLPKDGDVAGAQKRAEDVLAKLGSASAFDTLASQYSEDPNFAPGGALGTFKTGESIPELEAAASKLEVGEISKVVKSRMGFHVLRLDTKRRIPDPEFEKKKEDLRGVLYQIAFKKQFAFWLDQRRQEAFIRMN
jgi:peptidyl-prolyl cis-trans isomerase SurA